MRLRAGVLAVLSVGMMVVVGCGGSFPGMPPMGPAPNQPCDQDRKQTCYENSVIWCSGGTWKTMTICEPTSTNPNGECEYGSSDAYCLK
jgi:hypothetical protein